MRHLFNVWFRKYMVVQLSSIYPEAAILREIIFMYFRKTFAKTMFLLRGTMPLVKTQSLPANFFM